jgi:hypothetical protein
MFECESLEFLQPQPLSFNHLDTQSVWIRVGTRDAERGHLRGRSQPRIQRTLRRRLPCRPCSDTGQRHFVAHDLAQLTHPSRGDSGLQSPEALSAISARGSAPAKSSAIRQARSMGFIDAALNEAAGAWRQ